MTTTPNTPSQPKAKPSAYAQGLVKPNKRQGPTRRVWSVDLPIWVEFFTGQNVVGTTNVPAADLGAPIRLRKDRQTGEVRFGRNGLPQLMVAQTLNESINNVRENFVASLMAETGRVQKADPEGYKAQVAAAHKAAAPIFKEMESDVELAIAQRKAAEEAQKAKDAAAAQTIKAAEAVITEMPAPASEPEPVAA